MNDTYGDTDLSRRLSIAVAQIYAATVGSLAPLLRRSELDCTEQALLAGEMGRVTTEALRRFCVPLTSRIAADLNQADGREPMRGTDWRVVLYCLGGARTLREAISRCIECFEAIDHRMGRMTLRTRSETAELQLDSMRAKRTFPGCVVDLQGIANFHGLLGWLIASRLPVLAIALDYDSDVFDAMTLPTSPLTVLLDTGWTGLIFPAAFLDYPIVRANNEVIDWPRHSFLFNVAGNEPEFGTADKVRSFAYQALRDNHCLPSFQQIARYRNTSAATLRRRLSSEGTTYRSIKNSCRREIGLELLRGSTLTIEQISDRLDFCDSDAFRRAFHDWAGVSPSKYRRDVREKNTHGTKTGSRALV